MKLKYVCTFFLMWLALDASAQLKGFVKDQKGSAIQDLTILNRNNQAHTHTDENGFFGVLKAVVGDTLVISRIGFTSVVRVVSATDFNGLLEIEMIEAPIALQEVAITQSLHQNLQQIDQLVKPVRNSQELLSLVPGLFIAQHAGGGKAEQIFLRGFDIDHGTDLSISVDQVVPVNMVSHAHGQGYSDLHFVIPESIKNIYWEKGPYNASKGNFSNAGMVDFNLKDEIQQNTVVFETGKFQYNRTAALIKLVDQQPHHLYAAAEYMTSDGYFEHPQDFSRFNGLIKFSHPNWKITAGHFNSTWSASGQIPERAVQQGLIDRFGAIDPNEGGKTSRTNIYFQYLKKFNSNKTIRWKSYYSHYQFELFSNFTFFLVDSINGDQIKQRENRNIFGTETSLQGYWKDIQWMIAGGDRLDLVKDLELSRTVNRTQTTAALALGSVTENNAYAYLKLEYHFKGLHIDLQNRIDHFHFNYLDLLSSIGNEHTKSAVAVSPKLHLSYDLSSRLQVFTKMGMGFHSNDTRLLVNEKNPTLLPRSKGIDLGFQAKPSNRVLFHFGLWHLSMEDELVYVGDEAIVESAGATKRNGLDIGMRWQIFDWLHLDAESSFVRARSVNDPEGMNYIPLATEWTHTGGLQCKLNKNISASLRYRIITDRPANEDYSIVAKGYELLDGSIAYQWKSLNINLLCENITNVEWNEAQFETTSRLKNEMSEVEELHFTPGSPFNLRLKFQLSF